MQRVDRRDRRAPRRDNILHHHTAVLGTEIRPLDAPLKAVRLGLLAHDERLLARPRSERGAGERVRAHGHAAHRGAAPRGHLCGEQRADRGEARGAEDRALDVHVVLRARAARQRHLADLQGMLAQLHHQPLSRQRQVTTTFG